MKNVQTFDLEQVSYFAGTNKALIFAGCILLMIVVFIIFAVIESGSEGVRMVIFGMGVICAIPLALLWQKYSYGIQERSLIESIKQDYGAEATDVKLFLHLDEKTKRNLTVNNIVPINSFYLGSAEDMTTCYRYVDEKAEKYFVLCDQDEPLKPLETLVKS